MKAPVFPLYERAKQMGVLDGSSALVLAPTATGKSYIGREAITRALERERAATHAYLVPFRALADEVFDAFQDSLGHTDARIRIVTGDYRDPIRPDQADLVVSTYESFVGLVSAAGFRPGVVVGDEVHLIADETRGPVVEGLFARLLRSGRAQSICALSAVVDNGDELAGWLGVPVLEGTEADRPVPLQLGYQVADDLGAALADELQPCFGGSQAIVFCSSRAGAEKAAKQLSEVLEGCVPRSTQRTLGFIAEHIRQDDPAAEDVVDLLPAGVVYHHAGLPKPIRRHIEDGFRQGLIRVITATPTLAAGVNLPAEIVLVRDIFRADAVRGVFRQVLLPSGEVLNMLGRAGRPGQAAQGQGLVLIERRYSGDPGVRQLMLAVDKGQGGRVASRLPDSFEGLMRFVLAEVAERGDTTREDIAWVFAKTLAYHADPRPIRFDRPFEEDIMEDIPAYQRVVKERGTLRLVGYQISPAGVHAKVSSKGKPYEITLGIEGLSCGCPAASRYYRGDICKHQAFAIHELLFGHGIDGEARWRTIYICGHVFRATLDLGTLLSQALEILTTWRLVERVPGGWRSTPVGAVASASGFDLLLVHQIVERIRRVAQASYRDVAQWAVEDFFADERHRRRWQEAVDLWLEEVDERQIPLPARYRGDFERGLDDLARVCLLYEKAAGALGKPAIVEAARGAVGPIRYGVAPELVPLMALEIPQLARARSRYLYERGVRTLRDLAGSDPGGIADPRRAPQVLVRRWVERAKEIHDARAVAIADREDAGAEFDELIARFRIGPEALG